MTPDYKYHHIHVAEPTPRGNCAWLCHLHVASERIIDSSFSSLLKCACLLFQRFNHSPTIFLTFTSSNFHSFMADYVEHGRSSSFRQGDILADENVMRRSMTRGSHNSHASANASTRSWVVSNQMNPPPPPVERSSSIGLTPFHGPRPLPDPQSVRRIPVRNPTQATEDDDEGENLPIDPSSLAMQDAQQPEVLAERGENYLPPTSMGNAQDRPKRGGRSFIGGFMSGLRRLPTVLRFGGGQKSKRRLARQGTFGTESTSSPATGMTAGNTLPRYLSNPSIGPSNPQFAHRLSIAVANGALPPDASPSAFHTRPQPHPNSSSGPFQPNRNPSPPPLLNHSFERHPEPSRPNFPTIIRVTPPSANEVIIEEQVSDLYDEPIAHHPQFESHAPPNPNTNTNLNDTRATVMVYNNSEDSHESHPTITPPAQPVHVPRVSYAYQPSPRTSNRIRDEPPPLPTAGIPIASPPMSLPRGVSSVEGPKDTLSPQTSRYTTTTMASHYDPSFASHLTPVEKFFKGLYNLPWVARDRVTIDYRPGDSNRAKIKVRGGVKRPMASWYRAVVSRSRRGSRDLDLLSNGTGSASASTSLGNSLTPLASPTSRRSGRSSNNNRYQKSPQNHRHRKTRHRGTTLTDPPQRNVSPLLPAVYPYQCPPYPYTYPYGSYPPAPMPLPVSHTAPPRRRHAPKYPYGYAPYQPMPQPPLPQPMYFIAPSPPPNNEGQGNMTGQQAMPQGPIQISPVIMGYVPGGFNQDPSLASPPITPRRTTAPQS